MFRVELVRRNRAIVAWVIALIVAFFCCEIAAAQTTSVSATVVDTDGTTWANGTWKLSFVPNNATPNIQLYNINGTPLSQSVLYQNGSMNSSGALSFSAYQNGAVSPAGSIWSLIVCPNSSAPCGTYNFSTANNSTLNISSSLTPLLTPRFSATIGNYGYADVEAQLSINPGGIYYNVTDNCFRAYNGSTWSCFSNSGSIGGVVPNLAGFSPTTSSVIQADALTAQLNGNLIPCNDAAGFFTIATAQLCGQYAQSLQDTVFTTRALVGLNYQSLAGGLYTYPTGYKSNRMAMGGNQTYLTLAQQWLFDFSQYCLAGGDCIAYGNEQTAPSGFIGTGQQANAGLYLLNKQNPGCNDTVGGIWAAPGASVGSGTATFGTPTSCASMLAEGLLIRDLGSKYNTGTYSAVSCSGTPQSCTITGSGTSWTSISGFVGTHTTFISGAPANPILTSNLAFCAIPGGNYTGIDYFDACVPITSGTDDTHLVVNTRAVGTEATGTGWPWATSGSYAIYKVAWPLGVNQTTRTITAGDLSGLNASDNWDQVMAYNGDFIPIQLAMYKSIGRTYGGALFAADLSNSAAPHWSYGTFFEGAYGNVHTASCEGTRCPSTMIEEFGWEPPSGLGFDNDYDTTTNSICLKASTFSDAVHRCDLGIDKNVANSDSWQLANRGLLIDQSGDGIFAGNLSAAGSLSSPYGGFSPYNIISYDSTFQTVPATTYWSTIHNSGCTGSPNPFSTLTAASIAGPYDTGSVTSAENATTPSAFGGSTCTYIGQAQTGLSMVNGTTYYLVVWVKTSAPAPVTVGFGNTTCTSCAEIVINATSAGQWAIVAGTYTTSANQVYWHTTSNSVTVSVFEEVQSVSSPFVITNTGLLTGVGQISAGQVGGPIAASLTTTSATSDNLTITGMTSTGHCGISPTNSSAATNLATTYISAKTTNQITVTHTATASMTYDFVCTPF